MRDETEILRYDGVVRSLHWLTVLLVVVQYAVAWTMSDIHLGTQPVGLIAWHLSIGIAILLVMIVRAGWRFTQAAPLPPSSLSPALQLISCVTHVALYVLLVALPLIGWANASARGWEVTLFGVIPLPPISSPSSSLGHALGDVHQTVAIVLLAVIGLHLLGALYHLAVVRDRTIQRMV